MGAILLKPPQPLLLARPVGGARLKTIGSRSLQTHQGLFSLLLLNIRYLHQTMAGCSCSAPATAAFPFCCFAVIVVAPSGASSSWPAHLC
jgi:hypothetical protein